MISKLRLGLFALCIGGLLAHARAAPPPDLAALRAELASVAQQPWDFARAQATAKKIDQHRSELLKTPEGKLLIQTANQVHLASELSRRLEPCANGNRAAERVRESIVLGALAADPCLSFQSGGDSLLAFQQIAERLASSTAPVSPSVKAAFAESLLKDTLGRSATVMTQLAYLLDTGEAENGIPGAVGRSLCVPPACGPERQAYIERVSRNAISEMKALSYIREKPKDAASRISMQASALFTAVYLEKGNGVGQRQIPFFRGIVPDGATLKSIRAAKDPAKAFAGWADAQALQLTPQEFYVRQKQLRDDPLTSILARSSDEFARQTGASTRPVLLVKPGQKFDLALGHVAGDPNNIQHYTDKNIPLSHDPVSAKTLENLKAAAGRALISEMWDLQKADIRLDETLQRLLVTNPSEAGKQLLMNPALVSVVCDQLKGLASADRRKQWISGSMAVGELLLGFLPPLRAAAFAVRTGVRGAATGVRVSRAAAASIGLGAVAAVYEGADSLKISEHYFAACLAGVSEPSNCKGFKESLSQARVSLGLGGLGSALGVGFLRHAAKAAGSSDQMALLAKKVHEYLPKWRSSGGDQIEKLLGADAAGEFHAQLAAQPEAIRAKIFALLSRIKDRPEEMRAVSESLLRNIRNPSCER